MLVFTISNYSFIAITDTDRDLFPKGMFYNPRFARQDDRMRICRLNNKQQSFQKKFFTPCHTQMTLYFQQ